MPANSHRAMELLARFAAFEADFNSQVMIDYAREHTEVPVFAVGAYLWMIFGLPELLPARAYKLRRTFTAWNAALAAFSLAGASRVLPLAAQVHPHRKGERSS